MIYVPPKWSELSRNVFDINKLLTGLSVNCNTEQLIGRLNQFGSCEGLSKLGSRLIGGSIVGVDFDTLFAEEVTDTFAYGKTLGKAITIFLNF